jgi:hypothetical protein
LPESLPSWLSLVLSLADGTISFVGLESSLPSVGSESVFLVESSWVAGLPLVSFLSFLLASSSDFGSSNEGGPLKNCLPF